jgi:membrane fusion protein, multidrug efflux system
MEGIDIVGSLTPKFEAKLKSEYAGIITHVYVNEWVRVKKGTPPAKSLAPSGRRAFCHLSLF